MQIRSAQTRPTRPPGGGCEQVRAGRKVAHIKARGGSGGTARGKVRRALRERARAPHNPSAETTLRALQLAAWGRDVSGRHLDEQPSKCGRRDTRRHASGTTEFAAAGKLVSPAEQTSAFARVPPELPCGEARRLHQNQKPGATQAQPTHATPGDAREKRPTRLGLYHELLGVHTILDTLATLRIFKRCA